MLSFLDTWRADYYAAGSEEATHATFHPYYIKNDTGEPFIMYVSRLVLGLG